MLELRENLVGSWLGSATQVEGADVLATAFVDEHGDSDKVDLIRFADSIASLVFPRFLFLTCRPARIVAITSEGFETEDSGRSAQHVRHKSDKGYHRVLYL